MCYPKPKGNPNTYILKPCGFHTNMSFSQYSFKGLHRAVIYMYIYIYIYIYGSNVRDSRSLDYVS